MAGKKKMTKPKAAKQTKQIEMPTARDPKDAQIRRLAKEYVGIRDARMALTPKEVAAKKKLMLAMESKSLKVYNDGEFSVATEVVDNIKVKRLDQSDEDQTVVEGTDEE